MIKTDNLNEYVMLSVLKNICKVEFNANGCSKCNINAACECGCGTEAIKNLDIKYEPEQEEQINENENAEERS
ncbi:MAG: hypothetical protein SOS22_01460 [Absicoccus sp.]|uniref:hypothetical protein n=1 Tax=Absicoccus sp. TaxID=2718527 RepID=UPI002A75D14F|nr:hypothetical protein [Absicoccus sp.]MDY3034872.1 hypothetical protein [Absicoccus sp.]